MSFVRLPILIPLICALSLSAQDSLQVHKNSDVLPGEQIFSSQQVTYSSRRGIEQFLGVQMGVLFQDGQLSIHGAGSAENNFLLNGFNLTTMVNRPAIYIIPEAIDRLSLQAGGFTADRNALGTAVVATRLKSGGPGFKMITSIQTDKFAAEGETYLNTYSFREHSFTLQASGSMMDKHHYYIALENQNIGNTRKVFAPGFEFMNISNTGIRHDPSEFDVVFRGGFLPGNSSNRWALNSFFTFDLNPLIIDVTGLYDWQEFSESPAPLSGMFNVRDYYTRDSRYFIGVNLKYQWPENTTASGRLGYYSRSMENFDGKLGNNWQEWSDSAAVTAAYGTAARFLNRWFPLNQYSTSLQGFLPPAAYPDYRKGMVDWLESGVDITRQLSVNHQLSLGFTRKDMSIRYYSINPSVMALLDPGYYPNAYRSLDAIPDEYFNPDNPFLTLAHIYGYDRYGKEKKDGEFPRKEFSHTAAYLNYQYGYKNLSINAGIRYNYFNNSNLEDVYYYLDSEGGFHTSGSVPQDKTLNSWDPRLTLSYRAEGDLNLNAAWGLYTVSPVRYWQSPWRNDKSVNDLGSSYSQATQLQQFSYFNFSFQKRIRHIAQVDGQLFYKSEVREWKDDQLQPANPIEVDANSIRGMDLNVTLFNKTGIYPQLQYSYTDAMYPDVWQGTGQLLYTGNTLSLPSGRRHTIRAKLNYNFSGEGDTFLRNSKLDIIYSYSTGKYYIKPLPENQTVAMAETGYTPDISYLDLRFDKAWVVSEKIKANFFIRVNNVFDTKNIINVFPETGSAKESETSLRYDGYTGAGKEAALYKAINIDNAEEFRSRYGMELYGPPRQILLGLEISY